MSYNLKDTWERLRSCSQLSDVGKSVVQNLGRLAKEGWEFCKLDDQGNVIKTAHSTTDDKEVDEVALAPAPEPKEEDHPEPKEEDHPEPKEEDHPEPEDDDIA